MTDAIAPIRNYHDLIEAMRARKDAIGMSDADLDDISGLAPGYSGKVLGPSRVRGLGAQSLDIFMLVLAFDLVLVPSAEKLTQMRQHFDPKTRSHVRTGHRLAKALVSRVMKEMRRQQINCQRAGGSLAGINQAGGKARAAKRTAEEHRQWAVKARQAQIAAQSSAARSEAARKAARARWSKRDDEEAR